MAIGLANRGLVQERLRGEEISGYRLEHLELAGFTNYHFRKSAVFSLGIKYRLKEIFNSSEINEFRLIEQLEFKSGPPALRLIQTIRLEQRFRNTTIHRFRYEWEVQQPFDERLYFLLRTEALYAVSVGLKPEVEQRFSVGFQASILENLDLKLDWEYRMEHFSRDLAHEFFFLSGISLDLTKGSNK